jgi:hypothetical protein
MDTFPIFPDDAALNDPRTLCCGRDAADCDCESLVDTVTEHYVACALWSSTDWSDESGGEPLNENYAAGDLTDEARGIVRADVADLLAQVMREGIRWAPYWSPEQFGHDYWLTRNRYGAGFWDRYYVGPASSPGMIDAARIGDRLSELARAAGTSRLFVGDDGSLHVY